MLSTTLLKAYNDQIVHELHNQMTYLSMKAYFVSKSLEGFAAFMDKQSAGEAEHADKLMDYVSDHHQSFVLDGISKPSFNDKNIIEIFKAAYDLETGTTAKLKALYMLAAKENDFASQAMLDWFMTEQVEEETTILKILDKLELGAGTYTNILILDEQLKG